MHDAQAGRDQRRRVHLALVETRGQEATATVSLPFLGPIAAVTVTNLVEDDRPEPLEIKQGNRFTIPLRPFGVRTVRVTCHPIRPPVVSGLTARAVADMEVALSWQPPAGAHDVSHYHVYRGTRPDFIPGLLNLIERPAGTSLDDHPQLHYGGWINNRLEPATTYYYRVAAVDRWNNEGPVSPAAFATTLKSSERNLPPQPVECLRAVLVSPLSRFNAVNLLWRTGCESDIAHYEVHRSTTAGFQPHAGTRIVVVDVDTVLQGGREYGQTPFAYRLREFDHQMLLDKDVQPLTTYFYRVAAVDTAGQKGPFSDEVQVKTQGADPLVALARGITAQSVYAPEYSPELAVDGSADPSAAWISRPYGGGTKQKPLATWWQVAFVQKPLLIRGVKIVGDEPPGDAPPGEPSGSDAQGWNMERGGGGPECPKQHGPGRLPAGGERRRLASLRACRRSAPVDQSEHGRDRASLRVASRASRRERSDRARLAWETMTPGNRPLQVASSRNIALQSRQNMVRDDNV